NSGEAKIASKVPLLSSFCALRVKPRFAAIAKLAGSAAENECSSPSHSYVPETFAPGVPDNAIVKCTVGGKSIIQTRHATTTPTMQRKVPAAFIIFAER